MLDFQFRSESKLVVEVVVEEQNETMEVDFVRVAAVIMHFAVAADIGAVPPSLRGPGILTLCRLDHIAGRFHLGLGLSEAASQPLDFFLLLLNDRPHFLGRGCFRRGDGRVGECGGECRGGGDERGFEHRCVPLLLFS